MPRTFSKTLLSLLLFGTLIVTLSVPAHAGKDKTLQFLSNGGNIIYLAAGTALPLVEDGPQGTQHTLRTVDTLAVSVGIAEASKNIFREKRPDGSGRDSFPSGHATAAFAVATMESEFHHDQAPFWYLGATAIAASRVGLHVHYIHDVIAGAALGYGVAKFELAQKHGLVLQPVIGPQGSGMALNWSHSF